jgi:hypothetical protein
MWHHIPRYAASVVKLTNSFGRKSTPASYDIMYSPGSPPLLLGSCSLPHAAFDKLALVRWNQARWRLHGETRAYVLMWGIALERCRLSLFHSLFIGITKLSIYKQQPMVTCMWEIWSAYKHLVRKSQLKCRWVDNAEMKWRRAKGRIFIY